MVLESIDSFLLQLVRLGLGQDLQDEAVSCDCDWKAVLESAGGQGVDAIAADGLQLAYERYPQVAAMLDMPENKSVKYDWFGSTLQSEVRYEQCKKAIKELASIYENKGMPMMLLKGYGLSLYYPTPNHRPCGDIDVFLFGKQVEADRLMEELRGAKVNRSNPHHSSFSYEGFTVENHATFLDNDTHKSTPYIEGVISDLLQEPQLSIEVEGQKVFVPSVKLNSIYLLRHMADHFATEKITLRHLLDWALFIDKNAGEVDWTYVTDFAQRTNMHRFLSSVNAICVRELGFPEEYFPVPCPDEALASRVLGDILSPEWHGKIPPMRHRLRYGLAKTRRLWHNRWKYRIVYDETLWESFWTLAKNRMKKM